MDAKSKDEVLSSKVNIMLICTKALPLIDRTRFTVLTVNVSQNITYLLT